MKKFLLIVLAAFLGLTISCNQVHAMQDQNQKTSLIRSVMQNLQNSFGYVGEVSQRALQIVSNTFQNFSPVQKTLLIVSCMVLAEHMVAGDSMSYNTIVDEEGDFYLHGYDNNTILTIYDQISDFIEQGLASCFELADASLQESEEAVFEECMNEFAQEVSQRCQEFSISAKECDENKWWALAQFIVSKLIKPTE